MKARLRAVLLALAALLLFYGLAFGDPGARGEDTRPTSIEPGAAGYSALREWWATSGVRTMSLRGDYGTLARVTRDHPTGNLLMVTLPGTVALVERDIVALHQWVRGGNTLLVLAAACDSPEWARGPSLRGFAADVATLAGIELQAAARPDARFLATPAVARWRAVVDHPVLDGVRQVESLSDRSAAPCRSASPPGRGAQPLLRAADPGTPVVGAWLQPRGDGWVLLSMQATPFANRALGRADNARMAANILRRFVAPSGLVLFDDGLQGAPEPYDLHRLLADPRSHLSALALFVLWLVWIGGSTRLRTPVAPVHPSGAVAMVAAEARLLSRTVEPREAARASLAAFIARLPEGARDAPESWLAGRPGVATDDLERLGAFRRSLDAGGRVPLDPLHDLLTRLRRALA